MIQSHSLVLWRNPDDDTKESVDSAFDTLKELSKFGEALAPNYITAYRKRDARKFSRDYTQFIELVQQNVNKEGRKVLPDIGSHVSFFSSMREDDSAGISCTVGVTNPKFLNTFVLKFPVNFVTSGELNSARTLELFRACVATYRPFWGCILNNRNSLRFDSLWENNRPTTVQWINYFDSQLVERLGTERINEANICRREKVDGGMILQIKESPLDDESEGDLSLQQRVGEALHL